MVAAALAALDASGVSGRLEPLRPPAPPYEYDANAHILTDLIRHPTGSGSVSFYHEYGAGKAPHLFYVSVVWRPSP